jgi:hypothetical protein
MSCPLITTSVKAMEGIRLKQKNKTDKATQRSSMPIGILNILTTQVYCSIKTQYFKKANKSNCPFNLVLICNKDNFFSQPVKLPG